MPRDRWESDVVNGLSTEFKRAIAAAAVTRLMAASYRLDEAAAYVAGRVGQTVFPDKPQGGRAKAIRDFRAQVMRAKVVETPATAMGIARFHYDSCLEYLEAKGHAPKFAVDLLIGALLEKQS